MRRPDFTRRVVVTGLGVISPVGNDKDTAWANLVNGRSGLDVITKFDAEPLRRTSGRARSSDFDAVDVDGRRRPCAAPSRRCGTASPPPSRPSPTPASRSPTRTARTSGSCSAPAPAASTLMIDNWKVLDEKGPGRVAPTFIANGLVDSTSGMIAIETGAIGHNVCVVSACSTGTNSVGEAAEIIRRGDCTRHLGLDRDAAARGRARRVRQHARAWARRATASRTPTCPGRSTAAATASSWARARGA